MCLPRFVFLAHCLSVFITFQMEVLMTILTQNHQILMNQKVNKFYVYNFFYHQYSILMFAVSNFDKLIGSFKMSSLIIQLSYCYKNLSELTIIPNSRSFYYIGLYNTVFLSTVQIPQIPITWYLSRNQGFLRQNAVPCLTNAFLDLTMLFMQAMQDLLAVTWVTTLDMDHTEAGGRKEGVQ